MVSVRTAIWASTCAPGYMILLAGGLRSCNWYWSALRRAQVSRGLFLIDCPHHNFIEHVVAPAIELNGLADVAVLFLDGLVVGSHIHRKLPFFLIALLELQADRSYGLWFGTLNQREFVVIAIALMLEDFQILPGIGNQATLHAQITDRALQFRFGCGQFRFRGGNIRLHTADVGFYVGKITADLVNALLLGRLFRCKSRY